MKLNIGCGNNLIDGYVNCDKFDVAADLRFDMVDLAEQFAPDSIEKIVFYQSLEHIPWHQTMTVFNACFTVLQPGGGLLIEVPDLEVVCRNVLTYGMTQQWHDNIYGGYHRPWDKDRYPDALFHAGSIHYQGFTFDRIHKLLTSVGFVDIEKGGMEKKHKDYKYEENLHVEAKKPL